MDKITTLPMEFKIRSPADKPRWDVFLLFDTSAESLVTIAVYDLELYLAHQRALQKKGGPGVFETDERCFVGKGDLKGLPKDHDVGPGTGVLLMCDVVLAKHEKLVNGFLWYVQEIKDRRENPPGMRALSLEVRAEARIDSAGKAVPKGPFAMQTIGIAALPEVDAGGVPLRKWRPLAVRVLTRAGKVLLSNLHPKQSTGTPAKREGEWKNVARYRFELSAIVSVPPKPGTKPPSEPQPKTQSRRLVKPDPTGFYVQDFDGLKLANETQAKESRELRLVSPAGLWLHAAGRCVCGWYYPVPDGMLDSTDLFPADVRDKLLSQKRVVFFSFPPDAPLRGPDVPAGARRIIFLETPRSDDGVDPTVMLATIAGQGSLPIGVGWIRWTADGTVEISIGGAARKFERVFQGTRLAWAVLRRLLGQPRLKRSGASSLAALARADAEPIPPGTKVYPMQKTFTGVMNAMSSYAKAKAALIPDREERKKAIDATNSALLKLLVNTGVERKEEIVTRARAEFGRRTVYIEGKNRYAWDVLTEMVGDVMEYRIAQARTLDSKFTEPTPAQAYDRYIRNLEFSSRPRMNGFVALGVNAATRRYRYKLEFFTLGVSGGVFLKGAVGGFRVKVTKSIVNLDAAGKQVEKPDTTFHKGGASLALYGLYAGGGAGLSIGYDISLGRKSGGAGAGGPVDCVLESAADISADEFAAARFSTFAQVKPGLEIQAVGLAGGGSEWFDLVLELRVTEHKPQVVMTTVVKKAEPFSPKIPDIDSLRAFIKNVLAGDITKMDTLALNATLYALTASWGIFLLGAPARVEPPAKDKTPKTLDFDVTEKVNVAAFHRGKHSFMRGHENYLDANLSVHRKLLTMGGWFQIEGLTSPEWGDLGKDAAADKNEQLAYYRALEVRNQLFASVGGVGEGILPQGKEPEVVGKASKPFAKNFSETPDKKQCLDPFGPTAKTPEGKKRVRKEQSSVYPFMRRVDLATRGVYFMTLPEL